MKYVKLDLHAKKQISCDFMGHVLFPKFGNNKHMWTCLIAEEKHIWFETFSATLISSSDFSLSRLITAMYILPNQYLVQKFFHFDYLGFLLAALSQTMPTHPVCAGNQRERCFHKSLCVFISVVL